MSRGGEPVPGDAPRPDQPAEEAADPAGPAHSGWLGLAGAGDSMAGATGPAISGDSPSAPVGDELAADARGGEAPGSDRAGAASGGEGSGQGSGGEDPGIGDVGGGEGSGQGSGGEDPGIGDVGGGEGSGQGSGGERVRDGGEDPGIGDVGGGEHAGQGSGGGAFEPANELEVTLARCAASGARATALRALARSRLVALADVPPERGLSAAQAGDVQLPCVADTDGRHALLYTSYRQLALANRIPPDAAVGWYELPVAELFERWPKDVDLWLNAGGQLGFPLDPVDIATVADIAAGLEVDEAYEIGPDDAFTDFPGPSIPDQVDCAIVLSLLDLPEVLEVIRSFRRLEEPRGRTWRIVLVLADREVPGRALAQRVVDAINEASDECCEVHVAEVGDDDVYDAVEHLLHIGVPLWRRQGFRVPETLEGLADLDLTALETGGPVPDSPAGLGRDLDPEQPPGTGPPEPPPDADPGAP